MSNEDLNNTNDSLEANNNSICVLAHDENTPNIDNLDNTENNKINDNLNFRINKWKDKLLDLSKRNRLINYKENKRTIKIIDEQPPEIFRLLVVENKKMKFLPGLINETRNEEGKIISATEQEGIEFKACEFKKYNPSALDKKHIDNYLQTNLTEKDMLNRLAKIKSSSKTAMNDFGYNVLFLTLGSIVWYESENSDLKFESPLILIPVELERKSINDPFTISYNGDDIILNPALILKFKRDFGIKFEEFDLSDSEKVNVLDMFETIRSKIINQKRWKLYNNIHIGEFSFAKFVMYKDLENCSEEIKNSHLVKVICGFEKDFETSIEKLCPINELDKKIIPSNTFQILDADSSQQQAIMVAKDNNNLIIEGPPGTGKSQTIANMIAELLSQGKKVLFVSQKITALEVVEKRLSQNGLAPYCLEMHSDKINKNTVLYELWKCIENANIASVPCSNPDCVQEFKKDLNSYADEVHTRFGKLQMTPYEAFGKLLQNRNIPDLEYIFEDYKNWDRDRLEENKSIFRVLSNIVDKIGKPKEFSWWGCAARLDDYEKKLEAKNALKNFLDDYVLLDNNLKELQSEIYTNIDITNISSIDEIIRTISLISTIPQTTVQNGSIANEQNIDKIKRLHKSILEYNEIHNNLKEKYDIEILNEDIRALKNSFRIYSKQVFSRISFDFLRHFNLIKSYCINNYSPSVIKIYSDLELIEKLKESIEELNKNSKTVECLFSETLEQDKLEDNRLLNISEGLLTLYSLLQENKFNGDIITKINSGSFDYEKINNSKNKIDEYKKRLLLNIENVKRAADFDVLVFYNCALSDLNLQELKNKIQKMYDSIDNLGLWYQYLDTIETIKSFGLGKFYDKCIENNIEISNLENAFETQFLRIWLQCIVFKESKLLNHFNKIQHNDTIQKFRQLDKSQINSAKNRLRDILSTNAVNGITTYDDELNFIKREFLKQRKVKPLRQIMEAAPNLILALKPCLMMSPTTVAQFLNPKIFQFDTIIFDEASQLPVEDCIGAIIRGQRLIVAGDSKQLPPTSFFKTADISEDDEETSEDEDYKYTKEDLDSILDECSSRGFPKCKLLWHYRSRHEGLIAFSNKHLYENLYTFPSIVIDNSDEVGIKFSYYENNASTRENQRLIEAKLVAKAVIEHARKFPARSLGVATLNVKMQGLIESEINRLRMENYELEAFFKDKKEEEFFIKNLESIQGDERDVIFISTGLFKEPNGTFKMNQFGPINQEGGERRLNVLVTRARYKIEVFSSIKSNDIDMKKATKQDGGVMLLKKYLDFAERGKVSLDGDITIDNYNNFDSPFEEGVYEALKDRGHKLISQVGCSRYRIDLGVINKKHPGEFILGIECDGASYHSSFTARDRDRLRQQVLESLGWKNKIYRIWSTDWFKNPTKVIDDLDKYIQDLEIKEELMKANK